MPRALLMARRDCKHISIISIVIYWSCEGVILIECPPRVYSETTLDVMKSPSQYRMPDATTTSVQGKHRIEGGQEAQGPAHHRMMTMTEGGENAE